uniref:Uncharacterized protein n=1 Tax=Arundo donax TaxID=35708 RepID=A0A0A9A237_ARUDO
MLGSLSCFLTSSDLSAHFFKRNYMFSHTKSP